MLGTGFMQLNYSENIQDWLGMESSSSSVYEDVYNLPKPESQLESQRPC